MDMRATEPAVNTGGTISFLGALFVLVNLIWPGFLTLEWQNAISGVALILVPLITGFLIRRKVFAPASVSKLRLELVSLKKDYKILAADYDEVTKPPTPKRFD